MAVPNTTTFSLQDVVNEINPTTDDLVDCVADADSGKYDGTYYTAPATSLLEFRNYGAGVAVLAFDMQPTGQSTSGTACSFSGTYTTRYHDGSGDWPVNGDIIYTDDPGTVLFDGNSNFYRLPSGAGNAAIRVNAVGVVSDFTSC